MTASIHRHQEWRSSRLRAVLLLLFLMAAPASAQNSPYFINGRTVGMGEGGEKVFFTYYNVNHDATRPIVITLAEGLLDQCSRPTSLVHASNSATRRRKYCQRQGCGHRKLEVLE